MPIFRHFSEHVLSLVPPVFESRDRRIEKQILPAAQNPPLAAQRNSRNHHFFKVAEKIRSSLDVLVSAAEIQLVRFQNYCLAVVQRIRLEPHTVANAADFINQVKQALPFAIKQIQTDNGSEFSSAFGWHLEDLGINHRKTKIRSPEENGKVERSHRTDGEEFYGINRFVSIQHCIKLLKQWEEEYNNERPHMALGGKTPREYLSEKLKNHYSNQLLTVPTKIVQEVC